MKVSERTEARCASIQGVTRRFQYTELYEPEEVRGTDSET